MISSLSTKEFEGYIAEQKSKYVRPSVLKLVVKTDHALGKYILWAVPRVAYMHYGKERTAMHWGDAIGLASLTIKHTSEESQQFQELRDSFQITASMKWGPLS